MFLKKKYFLSILNKQIGDSLPLHRGEWVGKGEGGWVEDVSHIKEHFSVLTVGIREIGGGRGEERREARSRETVDILLFCRGTERKG